ncbi:MAG TPA: DUF2189 domain-containing protein [Pseudolabrys sp.]|nr:DUF2189 domain-containing protein [Pseudolabrys sp.]
MAQAHIIAGAADISVQPRIRRISFADLNEALRLGIDDFTAMPSHALFLCIIYPILGLILGRLAFGNNVLPLLFPLAAGFALIGPFAAIGLYELSRRREQGLDTHWTHAFDVFRSQSFGAIAALGLLLCVIFVIWVALAESIYVAFFGYKPAADIPDFLSQVFATPQGWGLIVVGNFVGFLFAVVALAISAVSFPLLLDRDVGAATAISTSVRAFLENPLPMAAWGVIVAALLVIGTIPFFLGLTVVLPVLGHATWHLYRKVVEADRHPQPQYREPPSGRHFAAEFPASLFARHTDRPQ